MSDARSEVLERVRAACGPDAPAPEVPRAYRRSGADGTQTVDLFCTRVAEYRAQVHRMPDLEGAVHAACTAHGARRLGRAPGLELDLAGIELVPDDPPLSVADLDRLDGVVTGCALAIAETGTIVLDAGPVSGRRALTLVPDLHICVVRAGQIVVTVPEAVAELAPAAREGRPITLVSGPSATSDIELQRVEGVHGPRRLEVVVVS